MSLPEEPTPENAAAPERKPFEKKTFFDKRPVDRPERFEDFEPWQEARRLANRLYDVTAKAGFGEDANLRDELRRAAVAVVSQLAEGVEAGGEREFARGLTQAKGSAGLVRALLFVAIDRGYLAEGEVTELQGRAASLARIIGGQLFRLKRAEAAEGKRPDKPGGFGPRKGGPPRPGGGGPRPGGHKPYGSRPGGDRPDRPGKPKFRPKRDE